MSRARVLSLIDTSAGAWLLAAPFALGLPYVYPHQLAFLSSLAVGAVVLPLSLVHGLQGSSARRACRINLSLGLLLVASPVLLGYGHAYGAGRTATVNAVITGAVIVAGAALCLAWPGPDEPPPDRAQRAPALWNVPAHGGPPQPFTGRADAQGASHLDQQAARAKLPIAWASVGLVIAGSVLLAVAAVLVSWALAGAGLAVAAGGAGLALKVRILSDVSLGQRPAGS